MASRNRIGITGQFDDNISGKLAKVRDSFDRLGKSKGAATVLQGVGMGVGISAWGMLTGAIGGAVNMLGDAIKAAQEEEVGIARLNASLAANVTGWDGNTDAIERGITARLNTGFADDAMRESMSRLVASTRDVNKAWAVMTTAMDLARFKGISLEEASAALIKVEGGQYRALKELGIVLKQGATATEALAEVQRVAGGQAEAYMETLAGKTDELNNRLDDLQETIGAAVIPELNGLAGALLDVLRVADGAEVPVDDLNRDLTALAGTLALFGVPMAGFAADVGEGADKVQRLAENAADLVGESRRAVREFERVGEAAPEAVASALPGWSRMRKMTRDVAGYLDDVKDAANDARDALFDASKGPKETQLELKGAKLEGKALADRLDELRKKKPTREVRQDIIDTKLAIIDNQKEVISLEGELVTLGKVDLSKHEDRIKDLGFGWDDAADELRTYIRLLGTLPGVKIPNTVKVPHGALAAERAATGGQRSGLTWVGEEGPELVDMGATSYVYTARQSQRIAAAASGGGAPVVVQLNLDGREVARVVDRHLYYEAARAPRSSYAG